jgi:uncharacterized membrane protein
VLAVLYAALTGLGQASDKRFFFDEVATIAVARQESPSAIWNALAQAADPQPPAYYLLEALSARVVGDPHVAYRLPSLLGFLAIPIAVWFFVRKRLGEVPALAAALLPLVMPVFTLYAIEARPYALMTGCIAAALVMWQDADKPWRTAALALCLILACTFSYSALLGFVPFGLAELVRSLRLRQVRVRVWLAFAAGCLPLVICWPLLSAFRQAYGAAFWARPQLIAAYGELVGMSARWVAPLVAATVIAWLLSLRRRQDPVRPGPSPYPIEEVALILTLVCLPVIIYAASVALHTPMVSRYALPAVLGLAIAAASLASAGMGPRGVPYLLGAILSIIAVQQIDQWRFGQSNPQIAMAHSDAATLQRLLQRHGLTGSPVVVSDGLRYLPMAYYAGSGREHEFVYLADPGAARKAIRTDSVDVAIVKLAPYLPMRVLDPTAFLAEHPVFLVFSENTLWDYLPRRLIKEGHSVQVLAVDGSDGGNHTLLRIELRGASARIDD